MPTLTEHDVLLSLQNDVVDSMEQLADLMARAQVILTSSSEDRTWDQYANEAKNEGVKVRNLELQMAIVAPMKCGKSTIVNAISGYSIMPQRAFAMTTLPTAVVFSNEISEPELVLDEELVHIVQDAVRTLADSNALRDQDSFSKALPGYSHLWDVAQTLVHDGSAIPSRSHGDTTVQRTLAALNDLIRLCGALQLPTNPLHHLCDVPRLRVPVPPSIQAQSKSQGTLVVVDTPGPDEAGQSQHLRAVVEQQIKAASLLLVVLDFTRLRTEAEEKIKAQVCDLVKARPDGSLYVLVNKIDQRRANDMTTAQLRQYVVDEYNVRDANHVFEMSAQYAFVSMRLLQALECRSNIKIEDLKELIEPLMHEAHSLWEWESGSRNLTIEEARGVAERLWQKSKFPEFLETAIQQLWIEAAPRSIQSALSAATTRLQELDEVAHLRLRAIEATESKVRTEVEQLVKELGELKRQRERLSNNITQKIKDSQKRMRRDVETATEKSLKEARRFLASLGSATIDEEHSPVKTPSNLETSLFDNIFASLERTSRQFLSKSKRGILEFTNRAEAEEHGRQVLEGCRQIVNSELDAMTTGLISRANQLQSDIIVLAMNRTQPIVTRAQTRLNQEFDTQLNLPEFLFTSPDINVDIPSIEEKALTKTTFQTKTIQKRSFWYWLWLVPKAEEISEPVETQEIYYQISINTLRKRIEASANELLNMFILSYDNYLTSEIIGSVDEFFSELDAYLTQYKEQLDEALRARSLSKEEQLGLLRSFEHIRGESIDLREKIGRQQNWLAPAIATPVEGR